MELQGETPKRGGGGGVHFKRVKWIYGLHSLSPSDKAQPPQTNMICATKNCPSTSVHKDPGRPSLLSCRHTVGRLRVQGRRSGLDGGRDVQHVDAVEGESPCNCAM